MQFELALVHRHRDHVLELRSISQADLIRFSLSAGAGSRSPPGNPEMPRSLRLCFAVRKDAERVVEYETAMGTPDLEVLEYVVSFREPCVNQRQ